MDFDFSPEQMLFRDQVRNFLESALPFERVRSITADAAAGQALRHGLADLGVFAITVPEDYGGLGLGFVDLALVIEEFGRHLVPAPAVETLVCAAVLARYGTPAQREAILKSTVDGHVVVVPALQEHEAGFDPGAAMLTASKTEKGWTLDGVSKILVPDADQADWLLVSIRRRSDAAPRLALVERGRAGIVAAPLVTLELTSRYYEVSFEGVQISEADWLEDGEAALLRLFDGMALASALLMVGVAGRVLYDTVEYAKQREQFGKPIGAFQAIKHRCADIAVSNEASRVATYFAAWAMDQDDGERPRSVSMAKSYAGDAARYACNEAIQLHGGIGFTWELGLHYHLRRVKLLEASYGDASWHRERLLAATLADLKLAG